jgi:hypothetical protein
VYQKLLCLRREHDGFPIRVDRQVLFQKIAVGPSKVSTEIRAIFFPAKCNAKQASDGTEQAAFNDNKVFSAFHMMVSEYLIS